MYYNNTKRQRVILAYYYANSRDLEEDEALENARKEQLELERLEEMEKHEEKNFTMERLKEEERRKRQAVSNIIISV